jgi:hypothetical protein
MLNLDRAMRNLVQVLCAFMLPMVMLVATATLLSGCPTPSGSSRVGGGTSADTWTPEPYPDPVKRRGNPPTLSHDEQMRQDEVGRYLAGVYEQKGYKIKATIRMPSGDIYDWIDAASVPGSDAEPPPSPCPGCRLPKTELDLYPELRGPPGTMPFVRSSFFDPYIRGGTGATSLEDFIGHYMVRSAPPGLAAPSPITSSPPSKP